MDLATYIVEAEVEAHHWWFAGRRRLIARWLRALDVRAAAAILDVGTGTGTNLRLLRELGFGVVRGVDSSPEAVRFCALKGFGPVEAGDVRALPFADATFDVVLATDILEHVDDDVGALAEIRRVLAPGGRTLVTVPAFASLRGVQDEIGHHKRRYRLGGLVAATRQAGLEPLAAHYFNYLLFVPIFLTRRLLRLLRVRIENENQLNSPLLNRVLTAVFVLDVRSAPRLRPPFGVSALLIAERRGR